jgi:hypothetical protein
MDAHHLFHKNGRWAVDITQADGSILHLDSERQIEYRHDESLVLVRDILRFALLQITTQAADIESPRPVGDDEQIVVPDRSCRGGWREAGDREVVFPVDPSESERFAEQLRHERKDPDNVTVTAHNGANPLDETESESYKEQFIRARGWRSPTGGYVSMWHLPGRYTNRTLGEAYDIERRNHPSAPSLQQRAEAWLRACLAAKVSRAEHRAAVQRAQDQLTAYCGDLAKRWVLVRVDGQQYLIGGRDGRLEYREVALVEEIEPRAL